MSSLYREFQTSSTITKVVAVALLVAIVGVLICACALGAWLLLLRPSEEVATGPTAPAAMAATATPAGPTPLPEPVEFTGWRGEYYDNPDLAGEPVVVRDDERIDFDWGCQPPAPGMPPANFSVRWTTSREVPAGAYRITMNINDGARAWIDDVLIIDDWRSGATRTVNAAVDLVAGVHNLRVEYFNLECPAVAQANAQYLQNFPDWKAEYFDNPSVGGAPLVVRNDKEINFAWGAGSPIPGVMPDDNYSVRWTQTVEFVTGNYLFTAEVAGGIRVWLDGQIFLDSWEPLPLRQLEAPAALDGGGHSLRVEYFKQTGDGVARLGWAKVELPDQPPVAVISGPSQAVVGQPVNFSARGSRAAEGSTFVGNDWEFGDGATGSGVDVSHVYNSAGTFVVSLTVVDDQGLSDTSSQQIQITAAPAATPAPGQAPVAVIVAPSNASVGDNVSFDASQSVCTNSCVSYAWDFGDGSVANAIQVQHVYLVPAIYNVILNVTDDQGLQGASNVQVEIVPLAAPATPVPAATPTLAPTPVPPTTEPTVEAPAPTATVEQPEPEPTPTVAGAAPTETPTPEPDGG